MKTKTRTLSTRLQIERAKAGVYSVKGAPGLGFKKTSDAPGAGGYTVRYRLGKRRPTTGIGSFDKISLVEAREAAAEAVKLARLGIDPIKERDRKKAANLAAKQPVNFRQATETHLEAHAPSWKHRHARANWFNPVKKYAYPILGELPVNDIVASHVAAVVRAAAADGNLDTGKRVQMRTYAILNGSIARGERDPRFGNPADGKLIAAIQPLRREVEHFRRIEIDDAPAAFRALREAREQAQWLMATALDVWVFMILTAARPSEALCAKWPGIDFEKRLWTLAATEMKSKRRHIVPLSAAAIEVLKQRAPLRTGDAVFAGRSGGAIGYSNIAIAPKKVGLDLGSPHSWRSVFSDWRGNKTGFARELAEFQLAHLVPGVAGDYQRESAPDRRVALVEAYARWLVGEAADIIAFPTSSRA
jgi:integrase